MFSSTLILVRGNPKNRENVDRAGLLVYPASMDPRESGKMWGVICLIQR